MASVHRRKGSKVWHGLVSLPDGKRIFRSTGQRDKAAALRVAIEWERVARGPLPESARQARAVLADFLERILGAGKGRMSVGDYLLRWIAAQRGEVEERTLDTYEAAAGSFADFVGREKPLDAIAAEDAVRWRTAELGRVRAKTVNNRVKMVRGMFRKAVAEGFAQENPFAAMKPVKETEEKVRRPFTREELQRVLAACDETWELVVTLGYQTGQRLGDIVRMQSRAFAGGLWKFRTVKTGKQMTVPLSPQVQGQLAARKVDAGGAVFPELVARLRKGDVGPLSKEFAGILWRAGLRSHSPHDSVSKKGRKAELVAETGNRRERQALSFHTLRHTARTWLAEEGVPEAVIDALIGHDGDSGEIYTTVGEDALRRAAEKLVAIVK